MVTFRGAISGSIEMAGDISHLEATNPFYYHVAAHLRRHHIALYSLSFYGLYERPN